MTFMTAHGQCTTLEKVEWFILPFRVKVKKSINYVVISEFFSTFVPKIRHKMRLYTHTILRILTVILLLSGLSGGGNLAYAATKPSGSGTKEDPYIITSADEWDYFNSGTGNSYAYIFLGNDISVEKMIYQSYDFSGVFDGQGHTLTVNISSSTLYLSYAAPFRYVKGATIKNLKVSGTINASTYNSQFAGGIVGCCYNAPTKISNCEVNVTINSSTSDDGSHGGLVGLVDNSSSSNALTIENCLFNGQLKTSNNTKNWGGFVGTGQYYGSGDHNYVTLKNCVFDPSAVADAVGGNSSRTFSRADHSTIVNCYYTKDLTGSNNITDQQGSNAQTIGASQLVQKLGEEWVVYKNQLSEYFDFYLKKIYDDYYYVDFTGWFKGTQAALPSAKTIDGRTSSKSTSNIEGEYNIRHKKSDGSWEDCTSSPGRSSAAGTYRIIAKLSSDNKSWYSFRNFPIVAPPTVNDLTYNRSAQALLTAPTSPTESATYKYSLEDNDNSYSTTIPSKTDAGSYTVYCLADMSATNGDYPFNDVSDTYTATINKKSITPTVTLSQYSYVYDNTAKQPTVTVNDGDYTISTAENEYTVSYSNNIEAGTATATVSNKTGGNYTIATTSVDYTITKQPLTVTVTANDLYYTGEEQKLVTGSLAGAGSVADCTLYYSMDGVYYSTEVPTGIKTKTYTVYYKAKGDDNHQDAEAATINVTIKSKKVTSPTITVTPSTFTYDGTEKEPDVTVKDGETLIHSTEYTVSYENNVNVGTAKVIITDNEGGNYIVSGTATFTIVENGSSYVPPKAKEGLVYTGKAQELIIGGSSTTGTMHYYSLDDVNYSTAIPKGTDAKTYTVYYKVVGDNNHYDSPATELTVVLSPKDVLSPTITLSPSTYTYDGTAKKPTVTVKDDDTEIPSSEYTVTYYNNTNIGKGRVKVTDNDGGNYCVNGSAIFYIVGEGSSFTEPTAKTDLTYNGKPQELIMPGSASSGTMKYSTDGKKYSTSIPKGTDAKTYNVYYKVVDSENNDQTPAYSLTVTISQKSVTISVTLTDAGANKMPSITVKDGDGSELTSDDYTYVVKDSDGKEVDISGKISAGDYVITVTPTGNYTGSSVTASFSVKNSRKFIFTMQSDIIGVCLPYNRDVPNNYQAYSFDRVADGNPVFKRNASETMTGGEPILLRYVGDQARTRATRTVDLSPSSPGLIDMTVAIQSQVNDGLVFTGTFNDINNTKGLMEGVYILQADDTWTHLDSSKSSQGSEICLEAFLTYFCYADHSMTTASLTTVLDTSRGDSPSAIHAVILEDEDGQQTWYDLNGHQIEAPQKGVNILRTKDGKTKKVVKK